MTAPARPRHPGCITDVAGLLLGHFTDARRPTGCSVVLCPAGAVAGVDVRGAAPGTRETDLLEPGNLVEQVHAILLTGGSAWGLAAADGVMRWLDEHGHGLPVGTGADGQPLRVPIVPAAVLFDLWVGDGRIRPDAAAGHAACEDALRRQQIAAQGQPLPPSQGNVGAGAGATVGKLLGPARRMRGGIGSASLQVAGVTVAALVAVNAVGDVRDPSTGRILAGALADDGQRFCDIQATLARGDLPGLRLAAGGTPPAGTNTTIGLVATDARLDKAQCRRMATQAHDGLARTIWPVHTAFDGDTLFALATGHSNATLPAEVLGTLAAEAMARAVVNAVLAAESLDGPGDRCLRSAADFLAAS